MKYWEFNSAIGPFFNNWGFSVWNLFLCSNGILAQKYSGKDVFKIGFHLNLGFPKDPGESLRKRALAGQLVEGDFKMFKTIRFPLAEIQYVLIKGRHFQNEVRIQKENGDFTRFFLPNRRDTGRCREAIKHYFSQIYKEEGFEGFFSPGRIP